MMRNKMKGSAKSGVVIFVLGVLLICNGYQLRVSLWQGIGWDCEDLQGVQDGSTLAASGRVKGTMQEETSDSTGKIFSGEKIRDYEGRRHFSVGTSQSEQSLFAFHARNCTRWAVVTTIFEPSEAVLKLASSLSGWCMVVVGDTKTPPNYASDAGWTGRDDVVYLSIQQQIELMRHPFVDMTPERSFARKNLGFLFAILHGANIIYDFDDDNVLKQADKNNVGGASLLERFSRGDTNDEVAFTRVVKLSNKYREAAFNPFPLMRPKVANDANTWPRGFPIESMQNKLASGMEDAVLAGEMTPLASIGVIQSVCDGDPDVDAIYRMTHQLPVYFESGPGATPLLIPMQSYSPYNAQATIHRHKALWGLYLPMTMTGRVSDIWRSYITQRIMKDIGLSLVYSPPLVTHHRNQHNYLADMEAEAHLYLRTTKLLHFLSNWEDHSSTLPARIEKLWIDLYERDYIGKKDVQGIQAWLSALEQAGYQFPVVSEERATATKSHKEYALIEDQPILISPRYNLAGPQGDTTYREFLQSNPPSAQASDKTSAWAEWLKGATAANRPPKRVLKMVLMTRDEWPLIQEWTMYHGEMIGFENLYILDGSTDSNCIAFLTRARDEWGANVVFSKANLNTIMDLLDTVFRILVPSSDMLLKMDTDEFLTMSKNSTACKSTSTESADCTLSPYGVVEYLNSEELVLDGRKLKIGYQAMSQIPSKEMCQRDAVNSEKIRMLDYGRPGPTDFKAFYDSRTFDRGDLGSHFGFALPPFNEVDFFRTRLGMLHARGRCYETDAANCRKASISHGFIDENDPESEQIRKLHERYIGVGRDICAMKSHVEFAVNSFASVHKVFGYAKFLECREASSEAYYAARQPGWSNPDLKEYFEHIKNKYVMPTL